MQESAPAEATWRRVVRQALILALVMFSALGCYLIVLKWRGPAATIITWTPWDELISFQPQWVWVYLLPYAIAPIVIGFLTPETFWWFIRRGLVVVAVTITIFIIVPTQTAERPKHDLAPGLTQKMYDQMAEIDTPPANAAPSLHVSLTFLLALALVRNFPRWWPVSIGGVLLVWAATLFTRQHHLVDVVSGATLAASIALLMNLFGGGAERPQEGAGTTLYDPSRQ